jgi:hypothetical protein
MDEAKHREMEEVLGRPVQPDLPEFAQKIRLNLMVAACVAIAIVYLGLRVNPAGTVLGLSFEGMTTTKLHACLFVVNLYLLAHFAWCALDYVLEWRLRITGSKVVFTSQSMWADERKDGTENPRNSTLYNWWRETATHMGGWHLDAKPLLEGLNSLLVEIRKLNTSPGNAGQFAQAGAKIDALMQHIQDHTASMHKGVEVMQNPRIESSLRRFDRWFRIFLGSQGLRWLIFEVGLPLILGSAALWLLARNISSSNFFMAV